MPSLPLISVRVRLADGPLVPAKLGVLNAAPELPEWEGNLQFEANVGFLAEGDIVTIEGSQLPGPIQARVLTPALSFGDGPVSGELTGFLVAVPKFAKFE